MLFIEFKFREKKIYDRREIFTFFLFFLIKINKLLSNIISFIFIAK